MARSRPSVVSISAGDPAGRRALGEALVRHVARRRLTDRVISDMVGGPGGG
jgi:hypothetical protein